MNAVVFRQTLRQSARTIATLALGVAAFFYLVILAMSFYAADTHGLGGFLRNPPRAIEAFMGGSADFLTPAGWVATAMLHPIVIALDAAAAFTIGVSAVATELERESIDLILTRPVRRSSFLAAKSIAALLAVGVVQAAGFIAVIIARATVKDAGSLSVSRTLASFLGAWVLYGAFAMIAVAISARSSLRGRALGIATGIVVSSFFINFIALLLSSVSGMRYVSMFHYFRPADILSGKEFGVGLLVLGVVGVTALAFALVSFQRRDLTR